jgi:membrane-associated phospholipid phosphatase
MALTSASQFRVPPPPAIDSDAYTLAYNEVKEFGAYDSRVRTADQTHQALWWKDFAENSHNRLARQIVADDATGLWAAARMFALLNMSIMDGYIASFDSKFAYNHWRPYTAIRWAANDGNPRTQPDPEWNNTHRHTYPFPSYPSAHGTVCAAAATVLADTFGARKFTMQTREVDSAGPGSPKLTMQPATRSFDDFQSAAMECALSRIWLGIHFRYDSLAGNKLGSDVGRYVVANYLAPVRAPTRE